MSSIWPSREPPLGPYPSVGGTPHQSGAPGPSHASPANRLRRRRSVSSSTEVEAAHTESETQTSEPPASSRRAPKRPRIILRRTSLTPRRSTTSSDRDSTAAAPSSSPPHASPPPFPLPSWYTPMAASGPSARSPAARRNPRPPPARPVERQETIVIDSSDSSDEDAVMSSSFVPSAEVIGSASGTSMGNRQSQLLSPRRRARRNITSRRTNPSVPPSGSQADPDSSTGDILVERVILRPPPIEVLDDSLLVEEGSRTLATAPGATAALSDITASSSVPFKLRKVQASPPRRRPPPVAHPLLSKYTCPICFSAPFPHVVATPCGHVFCSPCLFQSLLVPIKQKHDAIRDQMAAFSSLSALNRLSGVNGRGSGNGAGTGRASETRAGGPDAGVNGDERNPSAAAPRDRTGNIAGGDSGLSEFAAPYDVALTATTAPSTAPAPPVSPSHKLNPLAGTCPVCRAEIPGGFIAGHRPVAKRPVFGLELKLGKPIDDPRKQGATAAVRPRKSD